MKTIAVPTDFSFQTLQVMQLALQLFPNETVQFLLFSTSEPPTDVQDLLFLASREESIALDTRDNFGQGLDLLKKSYGHQIEGVKYDHFWGSLPFIVGKLSKTYPVDLLLFPQTEDFTEYKDQVLALIKSAPCALMFIPTNFTGRCPTKIGWVVQDNFSADVYLQASQSLYFGDSVETLFMTSIRGLSNENLKEQVGKLLDLHADSAKLSFAFNRRKGSTRSFIETTLSHQVDLLLFQQYRRGALFRKKDKLIGEISLASPVPVLVFPHNHFVKAA